MPFSLPTVLPTVPAPTPAIGATPNTPLNYGLGAAGAVGSNMLTNAAFGADVMSAAFGTNLIVQFAKTFVGDSHRWGILLVVLVAIGIFLFYTQGDLRVSVEKGFLTGWQALLNFHSTKVAGINILPGAPDPPRPWQADRIESVLGGR